MQSSPTACEKNRDETIKRNQLIMQQLGLSQAVKTATAINGKGQKQVQQQRKQSSNPTQPRRTSGRLNATKQPHAAFKAPPPKIPDFTPPPPVEEEEEDEEEGEDEESES